MSSVSGPGGSSINRLTNVGGPSSASGAAGASKEFSMRSAGPAAAPSGAGTKVEGMVDRLRERLAAGQSPDQALHAEVERELSALTGQSPEASSVQRLAAAVKSDPALSQAFEQLVQIAGDQSSGPRSA